MTDILIKNGFVITMEGSGAGVIEKGAVAVKGSVIEDVGPTDELEKKYRAHRVFDAEGKAVMPGLIDAHIHTSLALLRGIAQDTNNWLQKGIGPFKPHFTKDEIVKGSMMNILEGIKAGTTTFCDYDNPMTEIAENYLRIGARARIASMINELPPDLHKLEIGELYPFDASCGENMLMENIKLIEEWHGRGNGRITCVFGPQGPDMLSRELLLEIKHLAEKYDTKIYLHVAQGDREIDQMIKRYGRRSVEFLDEIGYLNERLVAIHLTEATKEEAQLMAKRGASMVHCPGSIGIIDGLVPPVLEFLDAGGTAALGSDQAPGNNCSNMFNEMKFAAILNKVKMGDPTVMPAWKVMRMATIEGAKAIGLENEIGSLRPGKKADIIIVNMSEPGLCPVITRPVRNIVPNLVYSARGHEVETVIIDGNIVMENRKVLTVNEKEVMYRAQKAAEGLALRAGEDFVNSGTKTVEMMEKGYL